MPNEDVLILPKFLQNSGKMCLIVFLAFTLKLSILFKLHFLWHLNAQLSSVLHNFSKLSTPWLALHIGSDREFSFSHLSQVARNGNVGIKGFCSGTVAVPLCMLTLFTLFKLRIDTHSTSRSAITSVRNVPLFPTEKYCPILQQLESH